MTNLGDRMNIYIYSYIYIKAEIQENITNMKDEIIESVKCGIDKLVIDARNKELEDIKMRDMNLTVFNLPEANMEAGVANKDIDERCFKQICSSLGLEDVNIVVSYRLGRRNRDSISPLS